MFHNVDTRIAHLSERMREIGLPLETIQWVIDCPDTVTKRPNNDGTVLIRQTPYGFKMAVVLRSHRNPQFDYAVVTAYPWRIQRHYARKLVRQSKGTVQCS